MMDTGEIVGLVTAGMLIVSTLTGSIVALVNVRVNKDRIDALQKNLGDAHEREKDTRRDIIMIGESLSMSRTDNAKLALLVNQLFNQYQTATGNRPNVDLEMLRHMLTIEYITGPLGPLDAGVVAAAHRE